MFVWFVLLCEQHFLFLQKKTVLLAFKSAESLKITENKYFPAPAVDIGL